MWLVRPRLLCREHLLGEHSELHLLVGTVDNHPHGRAIVESYIDDGLVALDLVEHRHEALAREMQSRDYDHDSPLSFDNPYDLCGTVDRAKSTRELRRRCDKCDERFR